MCKTCIHSMQGFSLFKVVILCDVTSNTMLFLLKSKGTAIYSIFFSKQKKKNTKKKINNRGLEGLRSLSKSHILNDGSTKTSVLESQNWLYATPPSFCFFFFLSNGFSRSVFGVFGWLNLSRFLLLRALCCSPWRLPSVQSDLLLSDGPLWHGVKREDR